MAEDICRIVTFSKFDPDFAITYPGRAIPTRIPAQGVVQETVKFCVSPADGQEDTFDETKFSEGLDSIVKGHAKDGGWKEYWDRETIPDYPSALFIQFFDFELAKTILRKYRVSHRSYNCYASATDDSGTARDDGRKVVAYPTLDELTWLNCMPVFVYHGGGLK